MSDARNKRLQAQREEMERAKAAELEAKKEERKEMERLRAERPPLDEDELKAACAVLSALPPGRLKDALTHLKKGSRTEVNLTRIGLEDLHLELAMVFLKWNKICEVLYLSENHIGPDGAWWIAEALKVNNKLKHLCLLGNDLADKGAITIAEALPYNETLIRLNLSRNYIRRDYAMYTNKTLKDLELVGNWIQPEGRRALERVLGAEFHLPPLMKYAKRSTRSTLRTIKLA